jgi:4-diphosphocytidyl-2-C-methyl-D-erythritol kinase
MPDLLEKLTISAPAKINLYLTVKNIRQDGYHDMESVFLALDFGDILYFEQINENSAEITVEGLDFALPAEKNIIYKALSIFREKTGFYQGLKINVKKHIPPGGGLGGGSSDAASTLLALNKIAGFPLGREALLEMAVSLGSDVPFFICETGAALVSGRGECIRPIEAPRWFFVLINPGFPSETAAAFRLLDEYRAKKGSRVNTSPQRFDIQKKIKKEAVFSSASVYLCDMKLDDNVLKNDFLPVFHEQVQKIYMEIILQLKDLGADFANLSGSGSTCFGVFKDRIKAEKAAASLRKVWDFAECCSICY